MSRRLSRYLRTILRPRTKIAAGLLLAGLGVTTWILRVSTVVPPRSVRDPVTVRLLSAGRHSGLLLPCDYGRVVEYDYGDWNWYALGKDDWWRAPATVLWPNQGTLGRRYVRAEDEGSVHTSSLSVERRDAQRLLARLDAAFAAGGDSLHSDLYDMDFVRSPERFWFAHDCQDATAEWLRELGCSVRPAPIRTGLSLNDAAD